MARLVYTVITSLDGYVDDASGTFDWAAPDAEVHAFVNDLVRPTGTFLCGRKLYETMVYWETVPTTDPADATDLPDPADDTASIEHDFAAIWQGADKVVYSSTMEQSLNPRTTVERVFAPAAVGELVAAAERDVSIGGPHLAAQALRAGLVDELGWLRVPVVVGGGTPALPSGIRLPLSLVDSRRFSNGTTFARYAVGR